MRVKNFLKRTGVGVLIASQMLSFMPTISNAMEDNIPKSGVSLYKFDDEVSLKAMIIKDKKFQKPLAYLAHYMGFGWCGGTKTPYIGDDFSFKMIDSDTFELQANYDENDEYSSGYRSSERLKIILDNVKFYMDGKSLVLEDQQLLDLKPLPPLTGYAYNRSRKTGNKEEDNKSDTVVLDFTYNTDTSWSKTEDYSFSEKIGISNKYSFDLGLMGSETTITAEFNANQGWSEMNGNSTTISQKQQYRADVPKESKRLIKLTVFKQDVEIPYKIDMYMTYDVTFEGFLRWKGNARNDHPKDRPTVSATFGGRNGNNAPEDLLQLYLHKDIEGYSDWDFNWMIDKYGEENVKRVISKISKAKFGSVSRGKFKATGGTYVNYDAGDTIPLTKEELDKNGNSRVRRDLRNINNEDITLEDVNIEELPGIEVIDFEIVEDGDIIDEKEDKVEENNEDSTFTNEDIIDDFELDPILMEE